MSELPSSAPKLIEKSFSQNEKILLDVEDQGIVENQDRQRKTQSIMKKMFHIVANMPALYPRLHHTL